MLIVKKKNVVEYFYLFKSVKKYSYLFIHIFIHLYSRQDVSIKEVSVFAHTLPCPPPASTPLTSLEDFPILHPYSLPLGGVSILLPHSFPLGIVPILLLPLTFPEGCHHTPPLTSSSGCPILLPQLTSPLGCSHTPPPTHSLLGYPHTPPPLTSPVGCPHTPPPAP